MAVIRKQLPVRQQQIRETWLATGRGRLRVNAQIDQTRGHAAPSCPRESRAPAFIIHGQSFGAAIGHMHLLCQVVLCHRRMLVAAPIVDLLFVVGVLAVVPRVSSITMMWRVCRRAPYLSIRSNRSVPRLLVWLKSSKRGSACIESHCCAR